MAMDTLWSAVLSVAHEEPGLGCIVVPRLASRHYHPGGLEWTYGEVANRVQALIDHYTRQGWGRGHRVALLLENRPEFMLHFLALNALGAWVIPINPDYQQADLSSLFSHSNPDLIVSINDRCDLIRTIVDTLNGPAPLVVAFENFLDALEESRRPCKPGLPTNEDEAVLLYTSGTSGMPKGCLIGNDYLFFAAQRYIQAGGFMTVRPRQERLYNPLPLFYANSLVISNPAMILSRNAMIFPDRFHPKSWWQELEQTRATIVHYLGIIPPLLLSRPMVPEETRHDVQFGVGAGISPVQQAQFESRFNFPLVEVWGMSEVGITTATQHRDLVPGRRSIGRPLAGVELDVIDDDGRPMPDCMPGELVLRRQGANPRHGLFRGYFKDDAATLAAWHGGWFHTGDVVQREADGSYTFVDRKKHIVRRSGQNIAAAEVEGCLSLHPAVLQVAVVAVPDELRQEEVLACVITGDSLTDKYALACALVVFALEHLAYFKVPGWVLFVDSLPTTATQKLQKVRIFEDGKDPRLTTGMIDLRHLKNDAATQRRRKE